MPHIRSGRPGALGKGRRVSATNLVCVVEDDPSVRTATGSLMRSHGYRVMLFDSAEAYLAEAPSPAHCLVCDVQMPGMNGLDLHDHLQACGRSVPTVFITGHAKRAVELRIGERARIVVKPFEGAELVRQIEDALSDHAD